VSTIGWWKPSKEAHGQPPESRVDIRRPKASPRLVELDCWLQAQLPKISAKTPLPAAIRHALTRTKRLRPYIEHGFLEIDNNLAERAMRPIALGQWRQGRRHRLHAHRDRQAQRRRPTGLARPDPRTYPRLQDQPR